MPTDQEGVERGRKTREEGEEQVDHRSEW